MSYNILYIDIIIGFVLKIVEDVQKKRNIRLPVNRVYERGKNHWESDFD